jgi:hypothetical protein
VLRMMDQTLIKILLVALLVVLALSPVWLPQLRGEAVSPSSPNSSLVNTVSNRDQCRRAEAALASSRRLKHMPARPVREQSPRKDRTPMAKGNRPPLWSATVARTHRLFADHLLAGLRVACRGCFCFAATP